jgi:transposase
MSTRIEVVGRVSGRRRWTVEQKLAILRDAFGPGGSVRAACEQHEIGSGSIYTWRRQAMSGELVGVSPRSVPAFSEVERCEPTYPVLQLQAAPSIFCNERVQLVAAVGMPSCRFRPR